MPTFPLTFEVLSDADSGIQKSWTTKASDLPPIEVSIPIEFGGGVKAYSPEDLFAQSILSCIIAMYKVYCGYASLTFEKIHAKARLSMDKSSANILIITHIDITIQVTGAADIEKAKSLLEKALKDCPVSNAIQVKKTVHLDVQ